jgi:hypothetical protein
VLDLLRVKILCADPPRALARTAAARAAQGRRRRTKDILLSGRAGARDGDDDKEVIVATPLPSQPSPEHALLMEGNLTQDHAARVAAVERDGKIVRGQPELLTQSGAAVAEAYVADLLEDVAVQPRGPDAAARLTAAGEALELILDRKQEAEALYRRAIRGDAGCDQAHASLRRLHRALGNWRVVAQLLEQEMEALADGPRRAQLALMLELLARTRAEAVGHARKPLLFGGAALSPVYQDLKTLLEASRALSDRKVDEALRLRQRLYEEPVRFDRAQGEEGDGEEIELSEVRDDEETLELSVDHVIAVGPCPPPAPRRAPGVALGRGQPAPLPAAGPRAGAGAPPGALRGGAPRAGAPGGAGRAPHRAPPLGQAAPHLPERHPGAARAPGAL